MSISSINQFQTKPFFKAVLPLPPGINASYKTVRIFSKGNIIYRPGATEALTLFKDTALKMLADHDKVHQDWAVINAVRDSRLKVPLKVDIDFYFKTLWKNDVDGPVKALQDAVFKRMELNDVLVVDLHAQKFVDANNPRCEISISVALDRLS